MVAGFVCVHVEAVQVLHLNNLHCSAAAAGADERLTLSAVSLDAWRGHCCRCLTITLPELSSSFSRAPGGALKTPGSLQGKAVPQYSPAGPAAAAGPESRASKAECSCWGRAAGHI